MGASKKDKGDRRGVKGMTALGVSSGLEDRFRLRHREKANGGLQFSVDFSSVSHSQDNYFVSFKIENHPIFPNPEPV